MKNSKITQPPTRPCRRPCNSEEENTQLCKVTWLCNELCRNSGHLHGQLHGRVRARVTLRSLSEDISETYKSQLLGQKKGDSHQRSQEAALNILERQETQNNRSPSDSSKKFRDPSAKLHHFVKFLISENNGFCFCRCISDF